MNHLHDCQAAVEWKEVIPEIYIQYIDKYRYYLLQFLAD